MSQNLKKLFENERRREYRMPAGHESRFQQRLEEAFPEKRGNRFFWIGMAASVAALLGVAFWLFRQEPDLPAQGEPVVQQDSTETTSGFSLGDLSPDLRKVEQYYTASIHMELANLDISDENKAVADDYMKRLRELDTEYQNLVVELNEIGPNEETISAMIRNFQLRLQLLTRLKEKLNELKQSKNESVSSNSV
ncbi:MULTISPECIES: hypothetical protein [Robiginitalea]|mgnify:CR=1 FL=1|nr:MULTISPECIES: hypothetical protein [Robiginitalea]MDC6355216.1 hypothetical protein [Robiginitalea sp. PM2]MDC6375569.1 hypothetical protein [Robiginitalea sp. SP8]